MEIVDIPLRTAFIMIRSFLIGVGMKFVAFYADLADLFFDFRLNNALGAKLSRSVFQTWELNTDRICDVCLPLHTMN